MHRLHASIGCGFSGYLTVEGDSSQLTWTSERARGVESAALEPTPEMWAAFWETLDRLNAWSWDGHSYESPGVLDGTYWEIRAALGSRRLEASGANGYPDAAGPEPGRSFRAFCRAVSRLAGGREFA
jgi:hypothetical protein